MPAGRGAAFMATARSFGTAVRVQRTPAAHTQAFYGGQAILRGGSRCSAGFNTRSGSGRNYVLTAGHCTNLGGTWTTSSGQTIGPVAASSFPGNDFGAIRISSPAALDPRGGVLYNGAFRDITGAGRVPVGSSACKTGSTTGTTCGTVQAYNVTVRYAEGTVSGLTRTNICTQPGDSGGAMFAGSLAQGITSGGTIGGCAARLPELLPAGGRGPERLWADLALAAPARRRAGHLRPGPTRPRWSAPPGRSGTGSTPIPGPDGTSRWPSRSTNGAVRSWR